MTIKIWGISDNRIGHINQLQTILRLLPFYNKLFILKSTIFGKLGNSYIPFGVSKPELLNLKNELQQGPPNILLVIGRRNLSIALYLKRLIKTTNPNIKLIFLMPPGSTKYKAVDLYFVHSYKIKSNKLYSNNIIPIDLPPSTLHIHDESCAHMQQDLLLQLQEKLNLKMSLVNKKPYIGVLIGGYAKGITWNTKVAKIFCDSINKLAQANNGTLIVSTSRRTGHRVADFIRNHLPKNSIFWTYHDMLNYNPYLDIIINCDALVVTGESTSMMADCITLNPFAKVLIFDNKRFKSNRHANFRKFLYNNNYATSLQDGNLILADIPEQRKLDNTASYIAHIIQNTVERPSNI